MAILGKLVYAFEQEFYNMDDDLCRDPIDIGTIVDTFVGAIRSNRKSSILSPSDGFEVELLQKTFQQSYPEVFGVEYTDPHGLAAHHCRLNKKKPPTSIMVLIALQSHPP